LQPIRTCNDERITVVGLIALGIVMLIWILVWDSAHTQV